MADDIHVRRSGADYAQAFARLLPPGAAWPRDPASVLMTVVRGLAQIWGSSGVDEASDATGTTQLVDGRAGDLLERESDPRQTVELLPDWETAFGLPDPCFSTPVTIADRQRVLVQKMTLLGSQSRAFFTQLAGEIGYPIAIREFSPFMCGVSRCGDTTADEIATGGSGAHMRWMIGPPEIRFYWTTAVAQARLSWFRCGSGQCGVDPMLLIGVPADNECIFNRWKPAHTQLVFDLSGLAAGGPFAGTP
jgi:uncharacterized protein YmfQ (DUF2313 family)